MERKGFISLILHVGLFVSVNNVMLTNCGHSESKANLYGLTNSNNTVVAFINKVDNKSINELSKNSSRLLTDGNSSWRVWLQNYGFDESFRRALGPGFHGINQIFAQKKNYKHNLDCHETITKVNCLDNVCSGDLIFEENFTTMNWNKWKPEVRIAMSTGDAEFVSYQNRPENCYVSNGHLHILPSLLSQNPGYGNPDLRSDVLDLRKNCTGLKPSECYLEARHSQILPPIVSARIQTKVLFQFRYGRVEVRAKLPKGDWLFPLILLEPSDYRYGPGYDSGQLRVAFARGNEHLVDRSGNQLDGRLLEAGAIIFPDPKFRNETLRSNLRNHHMGDDFHIYTLTWTNRSITLELDGQEYAVIGGDFKRFAESHPQEDGPVRWQKGSYMAPFDQEFHIALGLAVGGHSDFPDDLNTGRRKPWTNRDPKEASQFWRARNEWQQTWKNGDAGLHVDYVRVYAI